MEEHTGGEVLALARVNVLPAEDHHFCAVEDVAVVLPLGDDRSTAD